MTSTTLHMSETRPLRASQQLRTKIELVLPELVLAANAIATHPRVAELYPDYLVSLHTMVRATIPLMKAGAEQARAMAESDPVAAALATYLTKHIPEEVNHDIWLLEDLEVLGRDRAAVLAQPPSPTVAALVGSQYYWIFHYHPVALLGYMEIMEGYPPPEDWVSDLIAATGLPRQAFRSFSRHARLDIHHRHDLHAVLDNLPLSPEHAAIIGVSALQSAHLAARALREVVRNAPAEPAGRVLSPNGRDGKEA
jgi:hypothetical protein